MPVREYDSTMPSAPALTGEPGSLITLLQAVLVDGFGAQAAAGWSLAFSGPNTAVFRQGAGLGHVYWVDDSGPGAGGAREARMRGAEDASDVETLLNPFPTVAQAPNGLVVRKSATLDATPRVWYAVADAATCYLLMQSGDTQGGTLRYLGVCIGAFISRLPADAGRSLIIARTTENSALTTAEWLDRVSVNSSEFLLGGHYLARLHTQAIGAVQAGKYGDRVKSGSTTLLQGTTGGAMLAPNPGDLSRYLSPLHLITMDGGMAVRGRLRGFWQYLGVAAEISDRTVIEGAGVFAGRRWRLVGPSGGGSGAAGPKYALEISDTWEAP